MTEREVAMALCAQGKIERPGCPDEYLAARTHPQFPDELFVLVFDAGGREVQRFLCEIREVGTSNPADVSDVL